MLSRCALALGVTDMTGSYVVSPGECRPGFVETREAVPEGPPGASVLKRRYLKDLGGSVGGTLASVESNSRVQIKGPESPCLTFVDYADFFNTPEPGPIPEGVLVPADRAVVIGRRGIKDPEARSFVVGAVGHTSGHYRLPELSLIGYWQMLADLPSAGKQAGFFSPGA